MTDIYGDPILTKWWTDHDNIVLLAHYLANNGHDAGEVAYAVEKPWKYEAQFKAAKEKEGE